VLAATVNTTVPLPEPVVPDVMVSHVASLTALHEQSLLVLLVVMAAPNVPAAPSRYRSVGNRSYAHDTPPACDTLNGCPAIVRLPARSVARGFAATLYETVPGPVVPLAKDVVVMVSHGLLDAALHGQLDAAVTLTVPFAPCTIPTSRLIGEIV
jgi:hypothetical protein